MLAKVVSQLSNSGTGTQDFTTGETWTPKFAIFQWSRANTSADAFQEHMSTGYGFCDGTNQRCVAVASEDNQARGDSGTIQRDDAVICALSPTGTVTGVDAVATFSQWLSNGIQIDWTDAPTAQFYVTCLLIGGDDIAEVDIGTVLTTTGASASVSSLSYQPENGFFLAGGSVTENSGVSNAILCLGAYDGTNQWTQGYLSQDNPVTMITKQNYQHARVMDIPTTAGATNGYSTIAWTSSGFTLTNTDTYSASFPIYYLVWKGGTFTCGNDTEIGSVTQQTVTTNEDVQAVMMFGVDSGTAGWQNGAMWTSGMATATDNQYVDVFEDTNGVADSIVVSRHDTNQLYLNITSNATATSSTLDDEAAFYSKSATNFLVNWTNIGQARPWRYATFGSGPATITKSLTTRYNIEQTIEKSLTLRYDIEATIPVEKPLTLRYDITALVEKQLSLLYDIEGEEPPPSNYVPLQGPKDITYHIAFSTVEGEVTPVEKSLTLRYDVSQEVTPAKSLTLRYDITALTTKTLTLLYNISQEITKQLTTRYDISTEITKSLTTRYDINQQIQQTLTLLYNITGLVEKALTTRYNIEQEIEKILTTRYNITTLTEKALTLRYDINQQITKSLTLLYDIESSLTQIVKSLTLRYNIDAQIEKSLITRYNITEKVPTIPVTLRYDIAQLIEKINTLRYDIRQETEKSLILRYDIEAALAQVIKSLTLRYDITQKVDTVPITLRYNIAKEILKSLTLRFDIRQEILKELITRYDIEGALAQVIKSLTLRYDIIAEVIKSLTTRYNIEQQLLKSLSLRYNITELVPEKAVTLKWDILQQIIKTLTIRHQIEASIARYITDRGYNEPLKCRIQFIARGTPATVYYDYNSFDTANRPFNLLNLDIRLAQGEIGTFSFSIEDSAGLVDKTKIGLGVKIVIDVKKEATAPWQRIMTGFVRRIRPERPATGALIYEITGYGSQIVFNERIVNFKRAAKRTAIDSSIALSTDTRMEAHNLFRDLLTASDILPIRKPTLADTGGFTDLTGVSSDVIDFISQIAPGLTDAASVANAIAEITGCIWGTDENGQPFLRYPTQKHSGIIIKDVPESTDSALDTSINLAPFDFDDSIDTTEGFANRLYVLNAVSTKSTASSSGALGSTTLTTRGIAQQFTATDNNITGAAFILSKIGTPVTKDNCVFGYLRADNNGYPTGPTLASFQITFDQIETSKSTIFVNDIKPKEGIIIPGNKYWWFLFSALTDDSNTIRWHHDNDLITGNRISARLPLIDQDPTKPGNQLFWTRSVFGPVYSFSTFSSVRHILEQSDPESIKEYGLIEQIVDLPAFEDDATFQKALSKIIAYSAKPKRIYAYNLVTIPTGHLFFPGELVTVVDSKASLTSEKNVVAEIAEVTYNWDSSSSALGCRSADVHLIGFLDRTLDKYLDSKEC